jgi:hypothetical protein
MKTVEMTDLNEGIVELYAEHLLKKASSAVVTLAVSGAIAGAAIGAVPGLLSHSLISPGANYFAVLLGAIAGGFLGRSIGDRRAVGLRLQAQMALHQLQVENRLVAAPVARPAAPAPAPVAAPAPALAPPVAAPSAPPLVAPLAAPPVAAPPTVAPATLAPAPAPLVPAEPAPPVPAIRIEPAPAPLPAVPRLVEPPALPPLSQLAPPLRVDSTG